MNNKFSAIVVGGVIAALVVGAATLGAVLARPTTIQAAQAGGGVVRQVTVVGTGEAKAAPDQATVQLGVQTEAQSSREALDENSTRMTALIDQLKQLGIEAKDIQTSNFNISPTYSQNGRTVTGYQVTNMVSVTIRNIDQAGELLDQVVSAGANTIYGIGFGIGDPQALRTTARDAAIANARAQAEAMALAVGGSVGQVLIVSETINTPPPIPLARESVAMDQAAGAAPPIETGEQTITAQVQITYELR